MIKYTGEIRPFSTDFSVLEKLNLKEKPIGVKFMFDQPEGFQKLDKQLALCLMPEEARKIGPFYVNRENFECAEPLFLGIHNDDPFAIAGQIGTKAGLDIFQEARANRRIYEILPKLKPGSWNDLIFGPLDDMQFSPDVIVITGNTRQAEIIMRSYTYSTGARYESNTTPVMGCAWTFVYPYITGNINYIPLGLCFGHLAREVGEAGEISISIPFNLIDQIVHNLKEMTWELPAYSDGREGYKKRFKKVTSERLISRVTCQTDI